MKVIGKNFQKWIEFAFEVEGLTVFTGPSNMGKSSLFRAIRATLRNQITDKQIRNGTKEAEVTIEVGGTTVTARRNKKGVTYIVNGKEYAKLNGAIPEGVAELKFGEIDIGDVSLDPIFASQFGTQFLLQEGPQVLNTVLGAFSSTEKLEAGKREANQRIREGDTQARSLALDIQQAESRFAALSALSAQSHRIENEAAELEPQVQVQHDLVNGLSTLLEVTLRLDTLKSFQRLLVVPEAFAQAAEVNSALVDTAAVAAVAKERHDRMAYLVDKLDIDVPEDLERLRDTVNYVSTLVEARQNAAAATQASETIADVVSVWTEVVSDYRLVKTIGETITLVEGLESSPVKQLMLNLQGVTEAIDSHLGKCEQLVQLTTTITLLVTSDAARKTTIDNIKSVSEEIALQEIQIASTQEARAEFNKQEDARRESERRVDESRCPTCGQPLDAHKELSHA
jgi:DNA repair exonuclease SbcCD ATPase subunit